MGSHPRLPTPVNIRRIGAVMAVLAAVVAPVVVTLWVSTPAVADVQERVAALTRERGVVLLRPDQVPDLLAQAVVATEDSRFYSHHGLDTVGLARSLVYDATNRCLCEGGSTITQQLVKQLYLNGSDRGRDKINDMVLALKVEQVLSKPQIMADYLSEIATGLGRYGVEKAACVYFHAPLSCGTWSTSATSRPLRQRRRTRSRCSPAARARRAAKQALLKPTFGAKQVLALGIRGGFGAKRVESARRAAS